jgi:dTDP-4-amino-4,6-dideoxygalactose transaminase
MITITNGVKLASNRAAGPAFEEMLPFVIPEVIPEAEFLDDVQTILACKQLTSGMYVRRFEEATAAYLGVKYCVAVASCTAGLLLVMKSLNLRGDVMLPSFTFHATAHAVAWNGLKPVFVDCDAHTFCIDPKQVREQITPQTAAILAVHIFGNPAPVRELQEIANTLGIPLVYDSAHAFGSSSMGKHIGGFGTAEVFSFSPTKLVVAGEGGLIATNDARLAEKLRAARNYGDAGNYDPDILGVNARMSEVHGALALRGLAGLDARVARRNEIRKRYQRNLKDLPGIQFQQISEDDLSTCKDFSLILNENEFGHARDWLMDGLRRENIDVRKYFSPPVHMQKLYRELWDARPLAVTEYVSNAVISLPIYSSLTDESVDKVCDTIRRLQR